MIGLLLSLVFHVNWHEFKYPEYIYVYSIGTKCYAAHR